MSVSFRTVSAVANMLDRDADSRYRTAAGMMRPMLSGGAFNQASWDAVMDVADQARALRLEAHALHREAAALSRAECAAMYA